MKTVGLILVAMGRGLRFLPAYLIHLGGKLRITGVLTALLLAGMWTWAMTQAEVWTAVDAGPIFAIGGIAMLALLLFGWFRARFGAGPTEEPVFRDIDGKAADMSAARWFGDHFVFFLNWILLIVLAIPFLFLALEALGVITPGG